MKHRAIFDHLHQAIRSGRYKEGARLPSETELAARFGTSRPTAARALRDLEQRGLVQRRVGSGTYVRYRGPAPGGRLFGLLIPGLGDTEIFEPIAGQIARELERHRHAVLWGPPDPVEAARRFLELEVAGVFFAPVEHAPDRDAVNRRVLRAFDDAGVRVVLLDRDAVPWPERSRYDLVGIDNYRAGRLLGRRLIEAGAERIDVLARPGAATTVDRRIEGLQAALRAAGLEARPEWVHRGDPSDRGFVRGVLASGARTLVCANDRTAAAFLGALGRPPKTLRLAGFDDVRAARLLKVPLTTVRQPVDALGIAAASAMLERMARPDLPARDLLLDARLVVRD